MLSVRAAPTPAGNLRYFFIKKDIWIKGIFGGDGFRVLVLIRFIMIMKWFAEREQTAGVTEMKQCFLWGTGARNRN